MSPFTKERRCLIFARSATNDAVQLHMQVALCRSYAQKLCLTVVDEVIFTESTAAHEEDFLLLLRQRQSSSSTKVDCLLVTDLIQLNPLYPKEAVRLLRSISHLAVRVFCAGANDPDPYGFADLIKSFVAHTELERRRRLRGSRKSLRQSAFTVARTDVPSPGSIKEPS